MLSTKTRTSLILLMAVGSSLLLCAWAFAGEIEIQVSPNVLNLLNNGTVVTVHTNVPFSSVEGSTVTLNGVVISHWKSDNRGNFVAKFDMDEIKDLVETGELDLGEQTLVLTGTTVDGESFTGETNIDIVKNVPKKK
ncbi:hypothetical protein ACFL6U_29695 [Planctomycetota bacterium]